MTLTSITVYDFWRLKLSRWGVFIMLRRTFFLSPAVTVKWRNEKNSHKKRLQRRRGWKQAKLYDWKDEENREERQIKTSPCHFRHNFIADNYVDGFLKLFTILFLRRSTFILIVQWETAGGRWEGGGEKQYSAGKRTDRASFLSTFIRGKQRMCGKVFLMLLFARFFFAPQP